MAGVLSFWISSFCQHCFWYLLSSRILLAPALKEIDALMAFVTLSAAANFHFFVDILNHVFFVAHLATVKLYTLCRYKASSR